MTEPRQHRQGDVFLMPATIPSDARNRGKKRRVTLALGEVTGHSHVLTVPGGTLEVHEAAEAVFVRIMGAQGVVEHQEHAAHINETALPPGDYQVLRPSEYVKGELRRVAD
jgi:hypothetical protein